MNQVVTKTTREAEIVSLDDLYREAERLDVTPGWVSRDRPIFWKEPRTDFVPMHWDYKQVKDTLASAGAKFCNSRFGRSRAATCYPGAS
jgi:gentisate 1,2-dioxygenase